MNKTNVVLIVVILGLFFMFYPSLVPGSMLSVDSQDSQDFSGYCHLFPSSPTCDYDGDGDINAVDEEPLVDSRTGEDLSDEYHDDVEAINEVHSSTVCYNPDSFSCYETQKSCYFGETEFDDYDKCVMFAEQEAYEYILPSFHESTGDLLPPVPAKAGSTGDDSEGDFSFSITRSDDGIFTQVYDALAHKEVAYLVIIAVSLIVVIVLGVKFLILVAPVSFTIYRFIAPYLKRLVKSGKKILKRFGL